MLSLLLTELNWPLVIGGAAKPASLHRTGVILTGRTGGRISHELFIPIVGGSRSCRRLIRQLLHRGLQPGPDMSGGGS